MQQDGGFQTDTPTSQVTCWVAHTYLCGLLVAMKSQKGMEVNESHKKTHSLHSCCCNANPNNNLII
jgi:hypothetical protein